MSASKVKAGEAYVELGIRNRIDQGLKAAERDLAKFGKNVTNLGAVTGSLGLALTAPFAMGIRTLAGFDDSMRAAGAAVNATSDQLQSMTHRAEELGRTTSFTAIQVADLMTELGRAGFSPDQVNEMTGAVLDLARATGTDAVLSSGILSASIRQFGLDAGDAARVADVLTLAANASFTSVEDLGEALSYAGPVAKDFNMSIEETAAILGTLGNVGIQGSEAGTAIRRLLTITGAEAEKLQKIFGVSFIDAAGNARPLVDTLGEVSTATAGLGTAARSAKFSEAFGLLGITAASAIGKATVETKALYQSLLDAEGQASRTAIEMDAGLGGSFRKLSSAVEGVSIAVAGSFGDSLSDLMLTMTNALGGITEWIEKNKEIVSAAAITSGALVGIGGTLVATGLAFKIASSTISGFAIANQLASAVIGAAWSGLSTVFYVLTLKTRVTAAIVVAGWKAASAAISVAWTGLMGAISVVMQGAIGVLSAAAIAAPWVAGAAAIAVAWFGLEAVMGALSLGAAAAWTASAGVITGAWTASAGVLVPLAGVIAAAYTGAAAFVTGAWTTLSAAFATSGAAGVAAALASSAAWAAWGLLTQALAIKSAIEAAMVGLAWSAASALASAAWAGFGAVLNALSSPAALMTAAAAVVSGAWTSGAGLVSAAWTTAYAIITAPILPGIALLAGVAAAIAGIVAVAGYAAIAGADFAGAWKIAKETLYPLISIVNTTFNAIRDALGAEDYSAATQALWLGVQAAFWTGVEGIQDAFKWLFSEAWSATKRFFSSLLETTGKVMKLVAKHILNPFLSGREIGKAIGELINGAMNFDVSSRADASKMALAGLREQIAKTRELTEAQKEAERIKEESASEEEKRSKKRAEALDLINKKEREGLLNAIEAAKARKKIDEDMPALKPSEVSQAKRDEDLARIDVRQRSGQISKEEANKERLAVDENIKTTQQQEQRIELKTKLDAGELTPGEFEKQMAAIDGLSGSYFDLVKNIELEILALEKGETAAERKRLADEGLTEQQIKDVEALKAKKKALEDLKALQDAEQNVRVGGIEIAADQLEQQGVTPQEVFTRTIAQVNKDEETGKLDAERADQARNQAQDRLQTRLVDQGMNPADIFREVMSQIQQAQTRGELSPEDAAIARAGAQDNLQAGMDNLRQEGQALAEALRTPGEKLNAELKRIAQLQGGGVIDEATALRAEDKAREDFSKATEDKSTELDQTMQQEKALGPTGTFSGFAVGMGALSGSMNPLKDVAKNTQLSAKQLAIIAKNTAKKEQARAG
jgi:TP901 family phage tail tape measure protein